MEHTFYFLDLYFNVLEHFRTSLKSFSISLSMINVYKHIGQRKYCRFGQIIFQIFKIIQAIFFGQNHFSFFKFFTHYFNFIKQKKVVTVATPALGISDVPYTKNWSRDHLRQCLDLGTVHQIIIIHMQVRQSFRFQFDLFRSVFCIRLLTYC